MRRLTIIFVSLLTTFSSALSPGMAQDASLWFATDTSAATVLKLKGFIVEHRSAAIMSRGDLEILTGNSIELLGQDKWNGCRGQLRECRVALSEQPPVTRSTIIAGGVMAFLIGIVAGLFIERN